MRRRPNPKNQPAFDMRLSKAAGLSGNAIGIVLSGGGARAAYQVGALRALTKFFREAKDEPIIIIGSSIGAINGLVLASEYKEGYETAIKTLETMWRERNFRNTFHGSPSMAFLRAIKVAILQYLSPGPNPSSESVFDPTPLRKRVDQVIKQNGGLNIRNRSKKIRAVGVMTTIEGPQRKPLLFLSANQEIPEDDPILTGASFDVYNVSSLSAKHGFASAALPSILPPVEIDTMGGKITLVDGGISSNIPVDPAVRLGASRVIIIDVSGRQWWLRKYDKPPDQRPDWEVPSGMETYCLRPPDTFNVRCQRPLGPILKEAVGASSRKFIAAVGPTWPLFSLLKNKLGEEVAYETMSYVALDPDYLSAIIERGYSETRKLLRNRVDPDFHKNISFKDWAKEISS